MPDSVGQIALDLGVNYAGFNKQLGGIARNAESMAGGAFKKLGLAIGAAISTKALFDFGKGCTELASNLNEVQNVVDVTFGAMSEDVNNFAKVALYNLGLSELSAKKFTSTMGAMLKSSGISGKNMLDMSKNLTALAADMASFYNLKHEEAFEKIQAGISGETEPLKRLGINMNVANVEAYALSKGIKKSYQEMTQAEQIAMRYSYLLSVTKDAQGDFARTSGSWANQTKLLAEQWNIFRTTMGQGFINVLTPIVKWLNIIIAKLQTVAQYFKAFTEMLFGVSQASNSAAKATEAASSAVGDVGKEVKKAGKAVKGALAPFDQLNLLTTKTADSVNDIAAGSSGVGDIGNLNYGVAPKIEVDPESLKPFKDALDSVKQKGLEVTTFFSKSFGPPIKAAIETLKPSIFAWRDSLLSTFDDFSSIGKPLKLWFKDDLIPFLQEYIGYASRILAGLLDSSLLVFNGIRDAAMPVLDWFVTDGLPLVTDFGLGVMKVFESMFDYTKTVFDTLVSDAVSPGLKLLSGVTLDSLNMVEGFWKDWGNRLITGISGAFETTKTLFLSLWTKSLGPIVSNMLGQLGWLWDKHLKGLVQQILTFVGQLSTAALDIYNKFIMPLANWMVNQLGPPFSETVQFITNIIATLLGTVADVSKGIIQSLGGIVTFISGAFTGNWRTAWKGVQDIFKGIFNAMTGIVKGAMNLVIDSVNNMIKGLNKIQFKMPDWVPGAGGKSFGVKIPTIPKLANGGLVSAPTLAMVGDNKNAQSDPEVVSPLSKLQEMMGANNQEMVNLLRAILNAIQSNNSELILKIGETEFGKVAIKAINNLQRQSGQTLLII